MACRYLENVPAIVPLLEKEYRNAAKRLEDTQEELNDLNPEKYVPCHSAFISAFLLTSAHCEPRL